MLEIPVGQMTFRARASGPEDGRLVLLLHGFPESSLQWRHQLAALAEAGYRAVAPDQRGYSPGARPHGAEQYAGEHLVADVLAMADWFGAHRLDLVGHDWGGAVAWQVAGRYPDRLRSLTVVSTPHPAAFAAALASATKDQETRSQYVSFFRRAGEAEEALVGNDAAGLRNLYQASGLDPSAADEYLALLSQPGAMTAALNWYRGGSLTDVSAMQPVTVPTLYVWSDGDPALGREAAEATGRFVEGPYRFEVLEGVGHWIPEQVPERLNELLLAHLATA
jgi:pimeloyl-ACP methyl ester carboxylesterase